jgi:inosine-uridine preferring nucleoside hydrolase
MATSDRDRNCRVAPVVAACVVALLAACSSGSSSSASRDAESTAVSSTTTHEPRATGPSVIVDTDFSRWWDDATVIGLANVLHRQGALNLLGIVTDIPNPVAVAAIDAIDTAYGHDDIPLGAVTGSDTGTSPHGYSDVLARRLPHSVRSSDDVPGAVSLYRRLLANEPDGSVIIVSIGAYTNLAGLLASPANDGAPSGRDLVTRKVKRLVIMDGVFPGGWEAVTNQKLDPPAAQAVVAGTADAPMWPTPIAWIDGYDGIATRVGGKLCKQTPAENPMRIVYDDLFECGPPGDGNWDAPALLYAIGDVPKVFSILGRGGAAVINDKGGLSWRMPSSRRHDYYVHLADQAGLNRRIDQLLAVDAQQG